MTRSLNPALLESKKSTKVTRVPKDNETILLTLVDQQICPGRNACVKISQGDKLLAIIDVDWEPEQGADGEYYPSIKFKISDERKEILKNKRILCEIKK